MALVSSQIQTLRSAIDGYEFPNQYFDFVLHRPDLQPNIRAIEDKIKSDLRSGDLERVKNGLSNVLYWGYSQMAIRDTRVSRFRGKVTDSQLRVAAQLFDASALPSLLKTKKLGLPEFSGMSFVSKIRMFLDPYNSATLDFQIMKLRAQCTCTVLSNIRLSDRSTQILITAQNSEGYELWCNKLKEISARYFDGTFRAVDIERGFFQLVQWGKVPLAAQILNDT
jgi:hypothetical protein